MMEATMKKTNLFSVAILVAAIAGCSGNGGNSSHGNRFSIGKLIGGPHGDQADALIGAGGTLADAVSESDEDELGQTVLFAATTQWPVYRDAALNAYVTQVGRTLADSTRHP